MPTVVFFAWRIVINHAVLGNILAWWSASCLLLSRSFMFCWFTTVMFHHALLQVYYCHRPASCLLHVTFVSYQKNPFDVTVCLLSSCICSFFFHFTTILFFVWYSHIESARFVIVYHSCVLIHKRKRSMSRLTNPITPTDFFITEIRLSCFHNFFIIFLGQ